MEMMGYDVIVIGAGVAGLTAALGLAKAGLSVVILEARERIGGRILTLRSSLSGFPIELGAEFIHGLAPQLRNPLIESRAEISEVEGDAWCRDARLLPCDFGNDVDRVFEQMRDSEPDRSFAEFLRSCCQDATIDERAKRRALNYVVGFNAADPEQVGVHWLVKGMREEQEIMGDRAFRLKNGYADLLQALQAELTALQIRVMMRIAATEIKWREGSVIVNTSSNATYVAQKAVVTVPLSVLKTSAGQEGAIGFDPPLPGDKLSAIEKLDMGKVVRVVLRFRRRFWDDIRPTGGWGRTLSNMSFLLTDDEWFPTWWTTMPHREPQITGWAPFQCAERLSDRGSSFVRRRALESLSRILEVSQSELEILLEGSFFHDWQSDPFSRGAYSYGKVGADGAQQVLAKNLAETLYFAGEATASPGSNGTVHGAIASGERVCIEILG